MKLRHTPVLLAGAALALALGSPSPAATSRIAVQPATEPVPSLTPAATDKLWHQLVANPVVASDAREAACTPAKVTFYAATDWLGLATKLAANPSACAEYYVSIPPLSADKSQPRPNEASKIRALGPAFHAMAEINVTGWTNWVTSTGNSWYEAGLEARRRMAAAGYDVAAGDTWALNELSAAVRQGAGSARTNMRDFIDGLRDGDGTVPVEQGVVWVTGIGQGTADVSTYQSRLQSWYEDSAFWTAMNRDVSDWSQEVYGDVRKYAVPGAPREARRDALNQYVQHPATLAAAAPSGVAAAKTFVGATYNPLMNAAWQWDSAFGYTHVSLELMQDFVSAQVYAARSAGNARFGLAWQPKNIDIPASQFASQTDALRTRLAAAIADSSESPDGACGTDWCNRDLAGSSFTTVWQSFSTWQSSGPVDTTPPETSLTSGPTGTVVSSIATFTFTSEDGAVFECSLDGSAFGSCASPSTYANLENGAHHFDVRAIDLAGNPDPTPATADWTIAAGGRPLPPPPDATTRPAVPSPPPSGPRVPPPGH